MIPPAEHQMIGGHPPMTVGKGTVQLIAARTVRLCHTLRIGDAASGFPVHQCGPCGTERCQNRALVPEPVPAIDHECSQRTKGRGT
jgi:hypothetical protein